MIRYPSIEDVIALNLELAGGAGGVRDREVVESEVYRPQHAFGGVDAYPTIWGKAAALLHGLASTQGLPGRQQAHGLGDHGNPSSR